MKAERPSQLCDYFNAAATTYDAACELQTQAGKKLIQQLQQQITRSDSVIDLGCGTGLTTASLSEKITYKKFQALDFAEKFLQCARTRLHPNITLINARFDDPLFWSQSYDLIFANLALHWSEHFPALLQLLLTHLKREGVLAFSIPLRDSLTEIQTFCGIRHFLSQEEVLAALPADKFNMSITTQEIVLPYANLISALKSLKNVGCHYVAKDKRHQSIIPLRQQLRHKGHFNLTYQIGYFIIKKSTMSS